MTIRVKILKRHGFDVNWSDIYYGMHRKVGKLGELITDVAIDKPGYRQRVKGKYSTHTRFIKDGILSELQLTWSKVQSIQSVRSHFRLHDHVWRIKLKQPKIVLVRQYLRVMFTFMLWSNLKERIKLPTKLNETVTEIRDMILERLIKRR